MSLSVQVQNTSLEKTNVVEHSVKNTPSTKITFTVVALYPYKASSSTELSFQTNDRIIVKDATTYKDWWTGSLNGQTGLFPANYVERIVTTDIAAVSEKCDVFIDTCNRGGRHEELERMYGDLLGRKDALLRELATVERRVAEEDSLHRDIKASSSKYFTIMASLQKY